MIDIIYRKYFFLLIIVTLNVNYGLVVRHQLKTVIHYRGEDYYLKDGCPLPDCDDRERGCFKRQIELKKKFNGCYSGTGGKYMGCRTHFLPSGRQIVLPVFAKYCSNICYYDGDEVKQKEVAYCPYNGTRQDEVDELVQREMNRKYPTTTTTTERVIRNPDRLPGPSILLTNETQVENRNQVFGLRPVGFGNLNGTARRPSNARRTNRFNIPNRTPSRQTTQLQKTLHELIQEGFFSNRKDSAVDANTSENPPAVATSTTVPTVVSTTNIENIDETSSVSLAVAKQGFPIADASTLLELNEPNEGSADGSFESKRLISS